MKKLIFGLLAFLLITPVFAQDVADITSNTVTVGVSQFAPCVMKNKKGQLTGFDIELWESISKKLNIKTVYKETAFQNLIPGLEKGDYDVAAAGITINASREKRIDFSQPYLNSGLRIVVNNKDEGVFNLFRSPVALKIASLLGMFFLFIIVMAHFIWLAERGKDSINDKYFPGIFDACWFAVVTSSTVGYGDTTPQKWAGKLVSVILIFAGVSLFGIIAGEVSAAVTTANLNSQLTVDDLSGKLVATKGGTVSEIYLKEIGATVVPFDTIEAAYKKVDSGELRIAVFDSPSVLYYVKTPGLGKGRVKTTGELFYPHHFGFAFPQNSKLAEKVNRALLELKESGEYHHLYTKWFGEQ